MISHDKKFVFVHVPKTAGTSLRNALIDKSYDFGGDANLFLQSKHWYLSAYYHFFADYFDRSLFVNTSVHPLDYYYKFSIIRNPWDRMVSYFLYAFLKRSDEKFLSFLKRVKLVKDLSKDLLIFPRFRGFVGLDYGRCDAKLFDDCIHYNVLSKAYYEEYLPKVDRFLRFETVEPDYQALCIDLRIDYKPLPYINKNKNRTRYQDYYNDETINLVADIFDNEINIFKYNYEAV